MKQVDTKRPLELTEEQSEHLLGLITPVIEYFDRNGLPPQHLAVCMVFIIAASSHLLDDRSVYFEAVKDGVLACIDELG